MTITDYKVVRDSLAVHSVLNELGDETVNKRVVMSVVAIDDVDPLVDIVSVSVEWDSTTGLAALRTLVIADIISRLTAANDTIVNNILAAL